MPKRPKPIVLTVLDGWGYRAETNGNAIALARKPNYDRLLKDFPNAEFRHFRKKSVSGATPELLQQVATCDAVVTAVGD